MNLYFIQKKEIQSRIIVHKNTVIDERGGSNEEDCLYIDPDTFNLRDNARYFTSVRDAIRKLKRNIKNITPIKNQKCKEQYCNYFVFQQL